MYIIWHCLQIPPHPTHMVHRRQSNNWSYWQCCMHLRGHIASTCMHVYTMYNCEVRGECVPRIEEVELGQVSWQLLPQMLCIMANVVVKVAVVGVEHLHLLHSRLNHLWVTVANCKWKEGEGLVYTTGMSGNHHWMNSCKRQRDGGSTRLQRCVWWRMGQWEMGVDRGSCWVRAAAQVYLERHSRRLGYMPTRQKS